MLCLNRSLFTSSLFQVQFAREPYLSCYQICYLPCHFHLTAPDGTDLISVKPIAASPTCSCLWGYHVIRSMSASCSLLFISLANLIYIQCSAQRSLPLPSLPWPWELLCSWPHPLLEQHFKQSTCHTFLPLFIYDLFSLQLGFKIFEDRNWAVSMLVFLVPRTMPARKCSKYMNLHGIFAERRHFYLYENWVLKGTSKTKLVHENNHSSVSFYLHFWYCLHFRNICLQGFSKSLTGPE